MLSGEAAWTQLPWAGSLLAGTRPPRPALRCTLEGTISLVAAELQVLSSVLSTRGSAVLPGVVRVLERLCSSTTFTGAGHELG